MLSHYKVPIVGALIFTFVCVVMGTIHAQTVRAHTRAQSMTPAALNHAITYRVTGTASRVLLTYTSLTEGRVRAQTSLPWKKTVSGKPGDFAFLSAESCDYQGTVTTEILVNGVLWKKATAEPTGTYAMADCNGFLGRVN